MPDNILVPDPLTEDHYHQIQNALDIIAAAEPQIEKAKRAGVDVSASEQRMRDSKEKLLRLKNVYFPGR